jgi:hypothetical protein
MSSNRAAAAFQQVKFPPTTTISGEFVAEF